MKEEWYDFKKSFSQTQEDTLWQYFVDHSTIMPNGYHSIQFFIRNMDDFYKRMFARKNGDYKRYEIKDKEARADKYAVLKAQATDASEWHRLDFILQKTIFPVPIIWYYMKQYVKYKKRLVKYPKS